VRLRVVYGWGYLGWMKMTFNQPAPDGSNFSADAFDSQIGKEIPVNVGRSQPVRGVILSAVVADDGRSAEITIDAPDTPDLFHSAGSFGFADRR